MKTLAKVDPPAWTQIKLMKTIAEVDSPAWTQALLLKLPINDLQVQPAPQRAAETSLLLS